VTLSVYVGQFRPAHVALDGFGAVRLAMTTVGWKGVCTTEFTEDTEKIQENSVSSVNSVNSVVNPKKTGATQPHIVIPAFAGVTATVWAECP